jgi:hypothetical protein
LAVALPYSQDNFDRIVLHSRALSELSSKATALAAFITGILICIQYLTDELDPHPSLTISFLSPFCWPRKTFLY